MNAPRRACASAAAASSRARFFSASALSSASLLGAGGALRGAAAVPAAAAFAGAAGADFFTAAWAHAQGQAGSEAEVTGAYPRDRRPAEHPPGP